MVEDGSGMARTSRSWRCTLGFHAWAAARNDSGERYDVCERCGKASEWTPTGMGWKASD